MCTSACQPADVPDSVLLQQSADDPKGGRSRRTPKTAQLLVASQTDCPMEHECHMLREENLPPHTCAIRSAPLIDHLVTSTARRCTLHSHNYT